MRVRQNDTVVVITGRDRSKQGKVQLVLSKESRVVVEGLNMVKRHQKPTAMMRQAGIIQKEAPMPLAKVMLVCPRCNKGVRVGYHTLEDGRKVRMCRKCKEMIDL
ncbi:MAG: 50S ribosomal protein L24 [Chloroflexi bacterium]|nr:50S ribosomal protein L24 [Chloroflexota bacterium]MBI4198529.1 50S ribosomal protein L24 [Chloroflexota bacterium]